MFKKKLAIGLVLLLGVTACKGGSKSEIIQITGSDTTLNVMQQMSESYMEKNTDARIAVVGGGSGVGIAAAINRTTDIAMSSRDAKESELQSAADAGNPLEEIVFGWDGLAIVTNKSNPINTLSLEVVGKIFSGEISNWSEIGGKNEDIVILSRDSSSGTHVYFKEEVVRLGEDNDKEFDDNTLFMPSTAAIVQEAATNKNAIGYVGMGYLDDTINIVNVNGVEPTPANVMDKTYPIARELFIYAPTERSEVIQNFVDYTLSPEGQENVKNEGFVPAN